MLSKKFSGASRSGSLSHPLPGLLDELLRRPVQLCQRAIERPVGGQLDPPPVGKRGGDTPDEHPESPLDVLLQLPFTALQRVQVVPERERGVYPGCRR
jgi:hypothetical protein